MVWQLFETVPNKHVFLHLENKIFLGPDISVGLRYLIYQYYKP